jgi:tRNA-splicing ligase RtcB
MQPRAMLVCGFFMLFFNLIKRGKNEYMDTNYYRKVQLPAGDVHVYAGDSLFAELNYKVFEMANNNLQIPIKSI